MDQVMTWLARNARPILLVVAGALTVGAAVTVSGMPLVGWTIYGIGYVGMLVAFGAIAAISRERMNRIAWITFAVLYAGLLLGVPVMLTVWSYYAQNPQVHDALMPYALTPLGMFAGLLAWIGLLLFAWAAWLARMLSTGPSVTFVVAAVIGVLAEFDFVGIWGWALAIVLASVGLVWIAGALPVRPREKRDPGAQLA